MSTPATATSGPDRPPRRPVYSVFKRLFDVIVAGVVLVAASPVLLIAAIAVRLDSRGGALFWHRRVGRDFQPFDMCKFRTMVADAPKLGGQLTAPADPRVTRVGRLLRKTKIDELPQLYNVLVGQMSLVGPRPEVSQYVELFREDYAYLLSVRPGLTDPASIKYRDEESQLAAAADPEQEYVRRILPDKIAVSREYIARASLWGDFKLLAQTVLRVAR